MNDPILDSLIFLLRYRRAPIDATASFRGMKHNSDILPQLQTQLERVLDAHGRFREVIYDTQGIRDDGVDLAVRIPMADSDAIPKLIGFQVKSFDDLNKPGHMEKLKAQHSDATRKVQGLDYYIIMLCTDMKRDRDRVRSVMQEFRSTPSTEVIEPQFAYSFLSHPETRIDAIVKRLVESSDLVFRDALGEISAFDGPSARALQIYLIVEYVLKGQSEFSEDTLLGDEILERMYSELREKYAELLAEYAAKEDAKAKDEDESEDYFDEGGSGDEDDDEEPEPILEFQDQLAADLDQIETGGVSRDSDSGTFHLQVDQLRASISVVADALARFEYSRTELMNYAFDVFGIRD